MDVIIEELKTNGSVWATYTFDNPAIRADQIKRSYLELRDGLIFGSGYYVLDTQVQSIAYNQVLEYNHNGRDATLTEINVIPDEAVSTYIFVANPDTDMVEAQNADPEILGMSDWDSIIAITDKAHVAKRVGNRGRCVGRLQNHKPDNRPNRGQACLDYHARRVNLWFRVLRIRLHTLNSI